MTLAGTVLELTRPGSEALEAQRKALQLAGPQVFNSLVPAKYFIYLKGIDPVGRATDSHHPLHCRHVVSLGPTTNRGYIHKGWEVDAEDPYTSNNLEEPQMFNFLLPVRDSTAPKNEQSSLNRLLTRNILSTISTPRNLGRPTIISVVAPREAG